MANDSSLYELIYDFILNTSPSMSIEELAERFIQMAGRALSLKLIGVFIYDSGTGELVRIRGGYVKGKKHGIAWFSKPLRLPRGKGIVWEVFKNKKSVLIEGSKEHPAFYINEEEKEFVGENAFIVPLRVSSAVRGVLYIEKDGEFTVSDRKFFESIGSILEKTFENSELVSAVKREREEKAGILNSISYPIFLVDKNFKIREYNRFFVEKFKVNQDDISRLRCFEIVEKSKDIPENCPLRNLLNGKNNATAKIKVEDRVYEASIFRHRSVYGEDLFVHTMKDITEVDRKEKNLNLLYRVGISLTTSVSIDEFKIKVEEFLKQEKEVSIKIFWRDGVENHFDYKRPVVKKIKGIGDILIERGKSYSFPIDYLGEEVGTIIISSKNNNPLPLEKVKFYKTFATTVELALQNLYLLEELKNALASLNKNYKATLESLSHALDYREHETEYHSRRVASYAVLIGKKLGLTDSEIKNLYWGGLLHDIGKIGIPDSVLLKPGKLNEEEWKVMRKHPVIGFEILKHIEFLQEALKVVLYHHERWDGKGYPEGLGNSEIPLMARIFAIADTYDAITSDRPYRKAQPVEVAYIEIEKNRGLQFDPDIARVFIEKIKKEELLEIRTRIQNDIYYSPVK